MPKIKCICKVCSKEFEKWPSAIKQGKGVTCSYECLCKYRSTHLHNGNFKKGFKHTPETIERFKRQRKGCLHHNWKGGIEEQCKNGYIRLHSPEHPYRNKRNKVYKHRLIMEAHLGRFLTTQETIHHINGNKQDNRIENLRLFNSHSDHMKYHKSLK